MRAQIIVTVVGVILLAIVLSADRCNKPPELGDPLPGLSQGERERFEAGKKLFARAFVSADGLGPLFNAPSCAECHEEPVQGGVGDEVEEHIAMVRSGGICDPLLELGGPVLQSRATPQLQAHGISGEAVPPGLPPAARRTTPPVLGMGLLDAVPDAEFMRLADPNDVDGDGVSGRPANLLGGVIGRFGRKAQVAHLDEFTEIALLQEQGITTAAFPAELLPNGKPLPSDVDPVDTVEFSARDTGQLIAYMRFLAPPGPREEHREGEYLFISVGCAKCHVPELRTKDSESAALDAKTVRAYTDLLLHDMGPDLADICMGVASPSEFRTAPLMGLHIHTQFLHDGRAKTIDDAITMHGGEALGSVAKFRALDQTDTRRLLDFLRNL